MTDLDHLQRHLDDGLAEGTVFAVVDACSIARIAPSLGGVESLIEQPLVMSYYGVALLIDQHLHTPDAVYVDFFRRPAATRAAAGIHRAPARPRQSSAA